MWLYLAFCAGFASGVAFALAAAAAVAAAAPRRAPPAGDRVVVPFARRNRA